MRNRVWIIILLIVWLGQGKIGVSEISTAPMISGQAEQSPAASLVNGDRVQVAMSYGGWSGWIVWLRWEEWAVLVAAQIRCRLPWLACCACAYCGSCARSGRGVRSKGQRRKRTGRCRTRAKGKTDQGQTQTVGQSQNKSVLEPQRWGLTAEMSLELPERLSDFWQRYFGCFGTKTRNEGHYAYHYLSGLLRLESKRNYTNIGLAAGVPGENIQHFMTNSPWSGWRAIGQVQEEVKATSGLERGSVLLIDESADEKAGDKSVGAGRQHNGRLGKVDMSQVGVFVAYVNLIQPEQALWTWVDGELYLQEHWFSPEMAELRKKVGLPPERKFLTKIELAWQLIQRILTKGLPFEAVAFDDLYGRSTWLRDKLTEAGLIYMADVPRTSQVYLEKPILGIPASKSGQPGPKPSRVQVLNGVKPLTIHQVARRADTHWQRIRVRATERGQLNDPFAVRPVWTIREEQTEPVQEWLVIRHEAKNRYNYAFCNAPADTSINDLAWLKCQRYFVERSNQDAKSEAGWAELEARKYRAWVHHMALVILVTWFAAQIKWQWAQQALRDPILYQQFAVDVLPALSMANIRLLLRAAMPLPQPTPEQAIVQVTQHLVNRTRSRRSRLNRQRTLHPANAPP
jgi:SRSO17 transposase